MPEIISKDLTACVLVLNDEYWLPYTLEASRGYFERYVIYNVGSTDGTKDIIDWFINSNPSADFFVRDFECIPARSIQGAFRNSMIAEARTDYYFILDGDEVYTPESYAALKQMNEHEKLYGVVRRCEINYELTARYSEFRTHHRVYHRTAIFKGGHPGEEPVIKQTHRNEAHYDGVLCYHFHNAERSSKDLNALKREERKGQKTYHPGALVPFNLLEEVPLLQKPITDFKVAPALGKLQNEYLV
jgi:glycosyltransferase involved in cell wall biosynthesis